MGSSTKASQYVKFAEFMQFDDDFLVFRRFDGLNICNLLYLQHKLSRLDEEMRELAEALPSDDRDFDELMDRIQYTLKIYNEALMVQLSLRKPTNPTQNTVDILKKHSQKPDYYDIMPHLCAKAVNISELLPLRETEKTWADKFVANNHRLQRLFEDKKRKHLSDDMTFYREQAIRKVDRFLVTLCFCVLVLSPIVLLSYFLNKRIQFGILLVFVFGTSLLTSAITNSRNVELLALTAGYCAILVVFISGNKA